MIERRDLLDLILSLERRIRNNIKIQEGDEPSEDPEKLMIEINRLFEKLTNTRKRIDYANISTKVMEDITLNDLIVKQRILKKKHRVISAIVEEASNKQRRYSNTEIKDIVTLDIKKYLKEMDGIAKEIRELDVTLQRLNWEIDVD